MGGQIYTKSFMNKSLKCAISNSNNVIYMYFLCVLKESTKEREVFGGRIHLITEKLVKTQCVASLLIPNF